MAKKKQDEFDALFQEDMSAGSANEFERLLNSGGVVARGLTDGDRFKGEILAVSGQEAFISTGSPVDAVMPFTKTGDEKPKVGDFVDVMVIRATEHEILVKPVGSRGGDIEADSLEDAFDMELPVEGLVTEEVKGGFRVKVREFKAFCPISQMDWRVTTASDYVGKKYEFIITKFERGRDIVVSRRKLLELERAGTEGEFMQTAKVGDIFTGTIFRIEKYGAFVRLENGIDGLIPISEISWNRINHPQEAVNLDQTVQVKMLRMEEDGDRLKISFSLKQGGGVVDPWAAIDMEYPVGSQWDGTVERKEPFGLFVNVGPGVTGLLPRSAWRDATDGANYENKRRGDVVKVRIERVDQDARKLSFSLPGDEDGADQASIRAHTQNAGKSFGTMADLFKNINVKK